MAKDASAKAIVSNDSVLLQGKIQLTPGDTISLVDLLLPTYASQDPIVFQAPLDAEGKFNCWLPANEGVQEVYLMVGRKFFTSLWLEKGLSFELDLRQTSFLRFEGEDARMNVDFQVFEKQAPELHIAVPDSLQADMPAQLSYMKTAFEKRLQKDVAYFEQNPSPLQSLMIEQRISAYYGQLLALHWTKNQTLEEAVQQEIYAFTPKHTLLSNTSFYFQLHTYLKRSIVFPDYVDAGKPVLQDEDWQVIYRYQPGGPEDALPYDERIQFYTDEIMLYLFVQMKAYAQKHFEGRALERVLLPVNVANEDQFRLLYSYVFADIKTPFYRSVIDRRLHAALPQLADLEARYAALKASDKPTSFGRLRYETDFGAKLYVVDSLNEDNILSLLQQEFGNTPFLLDFWAVWCVPCIQSMPHSKQLQQALPALPFLYVCTSNSSSEKSWVKKVLEMEQPGIHLYVPEDMVDRWMKKWNLEGFPSVVLYKTSQKQAITLNNFTQISVEQLGDML